MMSLLFSFYGIFLLVFFVVSFFGLYQLWQFGYVGDASQRTIVLYIFVCSLIIIGSILAALVILR